MELLKMIHCFSFKKNEKFEICGKVFTKNPHIQYHITSVHENYQIKIDVFFFDFCFPDLRNSNYLSHITTLQAKKQALE